MAHRKPLVPEVKQSSKQLHDQIEQLSQYDIMLWAKLATETEVEGKPKDNLKVPETVQHLKQHWYLMQPLTGFESAAILKRYENEFQPYKEHLKIFCKEYKIPENEKHNYLRLLKSREHVVKQLMTIDSHLTAEKELVAEVELLRKDNQQKTTEVETLKKTNQQLQNTHELNLKERQKIEDLGEQLEVANSQLSAANEEILRLKAQLFSKISPPPYQQTSGKDAKRVSITSPTDLASPTKDLTSPTSDLTSPSSGELSTSNESNTSQVSQREDPKKEAPRKNVMEAGKWRSQPAENQKPKTGFLPPKQKGRP